MIQTITKNEKNLRILNKIIVSGFYDGFISPEKFELVRNHFPNNYRIIGILNNENNYDLIFGFKYPINIAAKLLIVLGLISSIILLFQNNWILPLAFLVFGLIMLIDFKLKKKKEINLFMNKLLEFYKSEYE